jgi:hypothetical protein
MSIDENIPKQDCNRFDGKICIGSYSLLIIPVKTVLATKLNACYRIEKIQLGINVTTIQPPNFS